MPLEKFYPAKNPPHNSVRSDPMSKCVVCDWACNDSTRPRRVRKYGGGKGLCETCDDTDREQ